MKRGNIFLILAFVLIAIAFVFYISSSITGEVTLEDASFSNQNNLEKDNLAFVEFNRDVCMGTLDYEVPPGACTNKKVGACFTTNGEMGPAGPRCYRKMEFGTVAECLWTEALLAGYDDDDYPVNEIYKDAKASGAGKCCEEVGEIADSFGIGINCCRGVESESIGEEGNGEAKPLTASKAYFPDPNFDGPGEDNIKCCGSDSLEMIGTVEKGDSCCFMELNDVEKRDNPGKIAINQVYYWQDQECCNGGLRDRPKNGCPACSCIRSGNPNGVSCTQSIYGSCDSSGPTSDFINSYSNLVCKKGCYISAVCDGVHNSGSQHYNGCAIDISCNEENGGPGDQVLDEIKDEIGWPTCGGTNWNGPCCYNEGDHLHCQTCRK